MKDKLYAAALLTLALCGMAARGQDKPKADSRYQILVEKLKSGDRNVDFKELRLAYADSPRGPDTDVQKKAMMAALSARDFAAALKDADVVLAGDYADMDAHFVAYVANRETRAAEQAEFHQFALKGLLKSITDSGDGKTPETAFQVYRGMVTPTTRSSSKNRSRRRMQRCISTSTFPSNMASS